MNYLNVLGFSIILGVHSQGFQDVTHKCNITFVYTFVVTTIFKKQNFKNNFQVSVPVLLLKRTAFVFISKLYVLSYTQFLS
jgi:hypothetical protein